MFPLTPRWHILSILFCLAFVAGVTFASEPVITLSSSTGGSTQNKDTDQDPMYLASQGDSLTFSATADQPVSFEWSVNKSTDAGRVVTAGAVSDVFTWTVPSGKGIWEIHLRVWNGAGEEAHREWVVSTLDPSEAPEFFDYFTDLKYLAGRTEKDPWNRALPEWYPNNASYIVLDSSAGYLRRSGDDSGVAPTYGINQEIRTGMTIPCGTWKFKYRFPDGNTGAWGFSFYYNWSSQITRNCYYGKMADTHHHCCVYVRPEGHFSYDYDGTGWSEDGKWHEITIIRTTDTWVYAYSDGLFEFYVQDKLNAITPDSIRVALSRNNGHQVYLDCIEVYKDKYLFPRKEVTFGAYVWNHAYNTADGCYYPLTRDGIIVEGRNMRLAEIAAMLGDAAKFSYDAGTKTAVCNADLVVYDNAEFVMENEILKFQCGSNGERHFVLKYGADVKILGSTITTTNDNYFVWNNASSTTHFGRPTAPARVDPMEFHKVGFSGAVWPLGNAGMIRFTAHDAVIDNAAHIFFDSPMELDITGTRFTHMHELDIGNYTGVATSGQTRSRQRWFPNGDKSFWVYMDEVNTNKFNLSGLSFSGKSSPVNITFLLNSLRDKVNIYDVNLENENVVVKKSLPQQAGQSHTWSAYTAASYESASYGGLGTGLPSRLGLVNCKFRELQVPTDLAWGVPKYYVDVKVIDRDGNPVSGADVTATNEEDNLNYPAENTVLDQQLFDPKPSTSDQYFYLSYKLVQGATLFHTLTGSDGHTALPSDSTNTMVLADYVRDMNGVQNFTYTITATKDGKTAAVTGLDLSPDWYRVDPSSPVKSVLLNIDAGAGEVTTGGIPPTTLAVTATDPVNTAANVLLNKAITVSFNKTILSSTGYGGIRVSGPEGDIAAATGIRGNVLPITPSHRLEYGVRYTVTVPGDAVKDPANRDLGSDCVFSFTASSNRRPFAYPVPYRTGKDARLTFTNLDGPAELKIFTIDGTLVYRQDVADFSWSFVPDLASGVYMYLIKDARGTASGKIAIIK